MSWNHPEGSAAAWILVPLLLLQIHHVGLDKVIRSVIQSQDATYRFLEGGCYIRSIFSASLKVRTPAILAAPPLHVLPRHLPLGNVHFVAQQDKRETVRVFDVSVICELFLPVSQVAKTLSIIQAEGEQAAVGAAVKRRAEAAEAFLTRRVPDLQRDLLAVHLQLPVEELHANGVEEVRVKFVGYIAVHEGGFADAAVAQKDDLHESRLGHHGCGERGGRGEICYWDGMFQDADSPEQHKNVSLALQNGGIRTTLNDMKQV